MNHQPTTPPLPQNLAPKVWSWYVAYCIALAVVYLALFVAGLVVLIFRGHLSADERLGAVISGLLLGVLGAVFAVGFAAGPFLPKKPWAWIYGMVLICVGMTSACCLPASIPLLIFWIKPETKAFFGRG